MARVAGRISVTSIVVGLVVAGGATHAQAVSPPTVVAEMASAVTQTSATLNGMVNPNGGMVSDCHFEYGRTTSYGSSVPCTPSPGSGASFVSVSSSVTGLEPERVYHYRVSATNAGGTSKSVDHQLTTHEPLPPTVVTEAASSITQTSATLNATVNPNAGTVSDCHFEYGTSEAYGSTAPCTPSPGSGESPVGVAASVTGLTPTTVYHVRISATNAGGTTTGSDVAFKTQQGPPTVVTGAASAVMQTSATLNATVNPNGSKVSECTLEYGTTMPYESSAPCTPSPGSGESPVAVSASIKGLIPHTTYHFRISATNSGGTSKGSDQTFTTLPNPPTVITEAASAVTLHSAKLNAFVNPNGGAVSECKFEYGTTMAYGSSAPCTPSPGSGEGYVAVSASLEGLSGNTTYHFRISATNAGGTSKGFDQPFETMAQTLHVPHYYSNGVLVGSEPLTVVGWGTLALKIVAGGSGEVACHTVQAGTVDNPASGLGGVGSTQVFAAFECEHNGVCPPATTVALTAEALPWPTALVEAEGGPIRAQTTGAKIKIDCQKEGTSEGSETFVGAVQPSFHHGTSALHPAFLEFAAGSGVLEKEGSKGGVQAKIEGEVRMLGYDEQELINVKNP
jgi:phosphodiesterase/alkaline phosphatase D-like protein